MISWGFQLKVNSWQAYVVKYWGERLEMHDCHGWLAGNHASLNIIPKLSEKPGGFMTQIVSSISVFCPTEHPSFGDL